MFEKFGQIKKSAVQEPIALSVVIPLFNEAENLLDLCHNVVAACEGLNLTYEIILVNDGSSDHSFDVLKSVAQNDRHFKVIHFRKNYGQTAAISAGLEAALGAVIVLMDGDLQNDPKDIALLLKKLGEGYDVVSGWRENRQDDYLTRILPSRIANWLISRWTGVVLRDYGCTLKAYRQEILKDVKLYGEMHRFLPFYASLAGAKICEIPVSHHPRKKGVSKYGLSRTFKVILDLITVKFLGRYAQKPIYFFGGIGTISMFLGVLVAAFTLYQRMFHQIFVHRNPLILLAIVLALGGLQFLVMGLLAEILMRTYHESQNKPTYLIKETLNFPKGNPE